MAAGLTPQSRHRSPRLEDGSGGNRRFSFAMQSLRLRGGFRLALIFTSAARSEQYRNQRQLDASEPGRQQAAGCRAQAPQP